MRIAIVADTFLPLRTSGAVQLRDLALEFVQQGHETTVLVADPTIKDKFSIEQFEGVSVVRLRTPQTKEVGHARRFFGELAMPWAMMRNLRASPAHFQQFDAVIWYSPTIFLGPLVRNLKRRSRCLSYLILRDIFPEWALDMGIISRGPVFTFLGAVAGHQYRSADVIGVQTVGNLSYFTDQKQRGIAAQVEVLDNWLGSEPDVGCSINISKTTLAGRRIFVYTGNMGVAQDMDKLLRLALDLNSRKDLGFLFVGRGSDVGRLREFATSNKLENTLFLDEISPGEIPGLLRQCHVGLLSLDGRHKTHNIPGKFLAYMRAELPVLASVNIGNDIVQDITSNQVGLTSVTPDGNDLASLASQIISDRWLGDEVKLRCRKLFTKRFSVNAAVTQILSSLASRANGKQK